MHQKQDGSFSDEQSPTLVWPFAVATGRPKDEAIVTFTAPKTAYIQYSSLLVGESWGWPGSGKCSSCTSPTGSKPRVMYCPPLFRFQDFKSKMLD